MSWELGLDKSGNENNWTANNITMANQMVDSPTNNFATLNAVDNYQGALSEGNLRVRCNSGKIVKATMGGVKYYFEWVVLDALDGGVGAGIANHLTTETWPGFGKGHAYLSPGIYSTDGTETGSQTSYAVNDIISMTVDTTTATNNIKYYKNNSLVITRSYACDEFFLPAGFDGSSGTAASMHFNFGQDSSFGGKFTAQGNQDGNDIGDFYYAPPTGFLALCTSNLPDVAVVPSENFNTVLYTGNESGQSIDVGFQPDWVWMKSRSEAHGNAVIDSVRGVNANWLYTNTADDEFSEEDNQISFDSDGFNLLTGYNISNDSGQSYVAWNWKAGNATLGTGDFTQGSTASTCSRNVDAGFSIVNYTYPSGANTIGHGLSKAPEMILMKNRDTANNWDVYHVDVGPTKRLVLNTTGTPDTNIGPWNNTAPTPTVFSTNNWLSAGSVIAYCFHSVDGYSKVGSYEGNDSADGTFVFTGFRPAFVIVKNIDDSYSWIMSDTKREPTNVMADELYPSASAAEYISSGERWDFLSNGFKLRSGSAVTNEDTHIYIAFAESPFKYSNAR